MNEKIKELFNKYGVKDLKDKNGQSECYCCKNIKHKFSLTWTSFLYEYEEDYYCFDCLLIILLQKENEFLYKGVEEYQKAVDKTMSEKMDLEHNWNELKKWLEGYIQSYENRMNLPFSDVIRLGKEKMLLNNVLERITELEEGGNNERNRNNS